MRLETFRKYFEDIKVFGYVFALFLIAGLVLEFCIDDIDHGVCICTLGILGLIVGLGFAMLFSGIEERMLWKRIENDRKVLNPDIRMTYNDFDDNSYWSIVERKLTWGKFDRDGIRECNLLNRKGEYFFKNWLEYIRCVDINNKEDSLYNQERVYVISHKNVRGYNLVYCYGDGLKKPKIVFDEPVMSFGDLTKRYIMVTFMDGNVNYVRLDNGHIMFYENLPGEIKGENND